MWGGDAFFRQSRGSAGAGGAAARDCLPCGGTGRCGGGQGGGDSALRRSVASLRSDACGTRGDVCAGASHNWRQQRASLYRSARDCRARHRRIGVVDRATRVGRTGGAIGGWWFGGRYGIGDARTGPALPLVSGRTCRRCRRCTIVCCRCAGSRGDSGHHLRWLAWHAGRDQFRNPACLRCAGIDGG